MRLFLLMLKVQFKAVYAQPGKEGGKGSEGFQRVITWLVSILVCALVAFFLGSFGFSLQALGAGSAVPAFASIFALAGGALTSFSKASDVLFAAKDYDFTMSLPVPQQTQVLARLASLYLGGVSFAAVLVVPLCGAAMYCDPALVSPVRLAAVVACTLLMPAPVVGVCALLAAGIAAFTARFKAAKALSTVLQLCAGLAIAGAWFFISSSIHSDDTTALSAMADTLAKGMGLWLPPAAAVIDTWCRGSWGALALLSVECVAVAAICVWIVSHWYRAIVTMVSATPASSRRASQLRPRDSRSPLMALSLKEVSQAFDTPAVVLNQLFGMVGMVAMAGAFAFAGHAFISGQAGPEAVGPEVADIIELTVVLFIAYLASICPMSGVATSLEGPCAWIMLTLPLPKKIILLSKMLPWCVMCAALSLVCCVLLAIGGVAWQAIALCAVLPFSFFWFTANLGLLIDVSRPNFGWVSPATVANRSRSVLVCSFASTGLWIVCLAVKFILGLVFGWSVGALAALLGGLAVVLLLGGYGLFRATLRRPILCGEKA